VFEKLQKNLKIAIPALILVPLLIVVADISSRSNEIARNVTIAGVDVGGLSPEDATTMVLEYQDELRNEITLITVKDTTFELDPKKVGLAINATEVVETAMQQRRESGIVGQVFGWFGSMSSVRELEVGVTIDPALLDDQLDEWQETAITRPAYEGAVVVSDGFAKADYPRAGEGIERNEALRILTAVLTDPNTNTASLPTAEVTPTMTPNDIDKAVAEANLLIGGPVTLRSDEPAIELVITSEQLINAFVSNVITTGTPRIDLGFDRDKLAPLIEPLREAAISEARDADWFIDEDAPVPDHDDSEDEEPQGFPVTLIPSRSATSLDIDLVVDAIAATARSSVRIGEFPFAEGAPAAFTTADAEAMGEVKYVSGFTTFHPAGQSRVVNIQLFAETVDGDKVWPGEEYSLNEAVGQRTVEKGFVSGGMILGGELVPDIGGGVSQFATTFYNASFFGCYEDIVHQPHSLYFSRYPEGREATISWPTPNLIIGNNTDTVLIIKTQYTPTSITVQFYGNNGGHVCESEKSGRFSLTEPPVEYIADATVAPGEEHVKREGTGGWSVTITRIITAPDGTVTTEKDTATYRPKSRQIEVHPCNMPVEEGETAEECPLLVPSVIGMDLADAQAALAAAGFGFAIGDPIAVGSTSQNGLVQSQSADGGSYLEAGAIITLRLGVYTES
jgi:vancomycin resistance protein YoaR